MGLSRLSNTRILLKQLAVYLKQMKRLTDSVIGGRAAGGQKYVRDSGESP